MKKVVMILLAVVVGMTGIAGATVEVDKAVLAASEKVLASMPADFYAVEPAAAQQQIDNAKPFILDVREPAELANGKIANSVNIPIRELPKSLAKLPENKTAPILTYCAVGYRGGMSVITLRSWGYTNVRTIKGGLNAWTAANLPVTK